MKNPNQLSVSNDVFDKAVKATAIVKKQRMRSVQERLHDLTSLKLVPKKWDTGANSIVPKDDQIKPIPVKVVSFKVAEIMKAMQCDNEYEFWEQVLSLRYQGFFGDTDKWFPTKNEDTRKAKILLNKIIDRVIRVKITETTMAINDVLGAFYHFKTRGGKRIDKPWIELYPQVIAYFSFVHGVSAENLATVVMIHELAHAYTLAGYDINMSRGNLLCSLLPDEMAEGAAQYYTNAVCDQLEVKFNGIKQAFSELLAGQGPAYHAFQQWTTERIFNHEAVRSAWIKFREKPFNYMSEQDFRSEVQKYNKDASYRSFY
jgi:hypothetical protein